MNSRNGTLTRAALALCLAAASATVIAQGRGGGGPPPGGGGMGGGGMNGGGAPPFGGQGPGAGSPGGMGPGANAPMGGPNVSGGQENRNAESPARTGLQLGPPGQRWWDDKSFAKGLKLRPEQQTRMDAIFDQNKGALLIRLQNLKQVESQMDEIAKSPNPDEAALFTQIDRLAQARAELEKANTHMLLQIRKEMDADQISRLEKRH